MASPTAVVSTMPNTMSLTPRRHLKHCRCSKHPSCSLLGGPRQGKRLGKNAGSVRVGRDVVRATLRARCSLGQVLTAHVAGVGLVVVHASLAHRRRSRRVVGSDSGQLGDGVQLVCGVAVVVAHDDARRGLGPVLVGEVTSAEGRIGTSQVRFESASGAGVAGASAIDVDVCAVGSCASSMLSTSRARAGTTTPSASRFGEEAASA